MYLVLKLTERYDLKVIQVYAPIGCDLGTASLDDLAENFYEDISKVVDSTTSTFFTIVISFVLSSG